MDLDLVHPLIDGLVLELPEPGSPMPWERQRLWLDCAASILVLLYPAPAETRTAFEDLANQMKRSLDETATKSTAARKDVQAETTVELTRAVAPDPAAGITLPAGTQAPPVDTNSAVPTKDAPRPTEGAADSGEVQPDLAESDAGEVGPETVGASPAQSAPGKPAGPSGSAAPTLADRLRALHAEHPEYTVQQAALALGETFERVRNNSNVNKIKWDREAVRAVGLQDRVVELHREHPDWTDAEIAAEIGKSNGYVRATAQRLKIVLPSRKRPAPVAEADPVEADLPAQAPEPVPEPEPAPAIAPAPTIGMAATVRPSHPTGRQFWLINGKGEYLNRYCQGFTSDRREAWTGNAMQLVACRRKFEIARDLSDKPVEKDQPVNVNREVA